MREIKFRAWDKESEEIINDWCCFNCSSSEGYDEDKIVMQYTGLKDKNGKEIYEGDWFKPDSLIEPYAIEVKWDCGGFSPFNEGRESYSPLLGSVIGNIYENPELLNVTEETK